jgi:type I restriction enzyme S subunit
MTLQQTDWKPFKLDELGTVGRGKSKHRPRNDPSLYGGDYPFFQTGDIKAANFRVTDYSQTYNEKGLQQSKLWQSGTLCITIAAHIGDSAILGIPGCFPDSIVGFVPHADKADVRFIKYYIDTLKVSMEGVSHGATQDNLSLDKLLTFDFLVPPLPVQRRIAGILSAYDELIENSQRRIRLLEDMARALYREWFVHFRFPGYESVPRIPSALGDIPQGWEVKEMQEVADVIDCLHSKKPSDSTDGPGVLLQLKNIGEGGKLDMRELFRISAEDYQLWTSRIELRPGDCVVTNVGRVGAVAQIPEGIKAAPGRNMTAIRVRPGRLTPTYLIEYLLSSHMESEVAKKKDLGTIMDSLNVKGIIRLHVPCPPYEAMERYEAVARTIRRRIELLVAQIQNLRRTRDLLLPRLLSGQVELSTVEVTA